MSYDIIGPTLKTQSFEISFEYDILQVIFYDDIFVVCLNPLKNSRGSVIKGIENNVYGINPKGEIIWRIQDPREVYPDLQWHAYGAFFEIGQRPAGGYYDHSGSRGSFYAVAFSLHYHLDYRTGKVVAAGRTW